MNKKVHFRTKTDSAASSQASPVEDTEVPNRSRSAGKRKIGEIARGMTPSNETKNAEKSSKRRKVSVYDAVAGRAGRNGFLATEPVYSKDRDTASSSTRPVPPDDILFSRKGARIRLAEGEDYVGVNDLGPIPPNDLLETMHRYVSRFYDRPDIQRKHLHYNSMDGTALLALGILLEEALEQSLGATGHLAFLTAADEEILSPELGWDGHTWVKIASRRLGVRKKSFESAAVDESLGHDEFDDDEASDVVENEYDGEVQDEWQSSSPSNASRKTEPRTESPGHIHEHFPTNTSNENSATQSSSTHEKFNISATRPRSARKTQAGRSKGYYVSEGYKSTAVVQSSDDDEDEAPLSEHDTEMADSEESAVQHISELPQSSTDSSSQSDSDREELETVTTGAVVGMGIERSRSASRTYRESPLPQASNNSRNISGTESEESSTDDEERSEPENEDGAAKATTLAHHNEPHQEPRKNVTRDGTSEALHKEPEDKMAKFKKSMDDLLDRLMSQ